MKILHLYPNLMNLYGDYGNLVVLKKHLEDQGLEVIIDKKEVDDEFEISDYDMLYMGSGTEKNMLVALEALRKYRTDLKIFVEEEKIALFTGNAMEIFGSEIDDKKGLNFLPFKVKQTDKRYTGDVILNNEEFGDVVGFINKCSLISDGEEEKLFDYVFVDNNLVDNKYEGYRYKNLFGTHVIGPVLVKNPKMMKWFVMNLLGNKEYQDIQYEYENDSYAITLDALRGRNK